MYKRGESTFDEQTCMRNFEPVVILLIISPEKTKVSEI